MYFQNCKDQNEAKALYRRLAMQYHPDRGGCTETMQAINAEYHDRLKNFDGRAFTGSDGKAHKYYYQQEREQAIIDKISEIFKLNMSNVTIELVGVWLWVYGETKPYRSELKELGFKWHSKRIKWYFHTPTKYRRKYSGTGFDRMRAWYGAEELTQQEQARPNREEQLSLS